MKKYISILLTIVFILTSASSITASAVTPLNPQLENGESSTYVETVTSDNRIIRKYTPGTTNSQNGIAVCSVENNNTVNLEDTKEALQIIGLSDDVISDLSVSELEDYALAETYTSITSYIKTDVDGNSELVSQEEAEQAVTMSVIGNQPVHDHIGDDGGGTVPPFYSEESTSTDEYMKQTFVICYLGDGDFKFSITSEWLVMPFWRFTDCTGVAFTSCVTVPNNCEGWYRYQTKFSNYGSATVVTSTEKYNFTTEDFYLTANGTWNGAAAAFNMPDNVVATDMYGNVISTTYLSEFKCYLSCVAEIITPSQPIDFVASGSYEHTLVEFVPDLSFGIVGNGVEIHSGFSLELAKNPYVVYTDYVLEYNPDE